MQPAIHKGALLGAIVTVLAILMAVPSVAFARPHHWGKEKAHRLIHKVPRKVARRRADFAVTYTGEASKLAASPENHFWLNGAAIDGALTFNKNLGIAGNLSTVHSNDIYSGISFGKASVAFGPRVTVDTSKWLDKCTFIKGKKMPMSDMYAEALFGVAHGFDGLFPAPSRSKASANSSDIQLGVGLDFTLWKHFGIRPFELDYIHTALPNGASNSQNDLRFSVGLTYHIDFQPKPLGTIIVPATP